MRVFTLSLSKYLSNKGLQGISDSKLFNTFFRFCIVLSDSIPSLTFLGLNLFSAPIIRAFSQSMPLVHSTLCLAKPPSSFPIRSFAAVSFPFFISSFVNLTLLSCSFFLTLNNFEVSPIYTAFLRENIKRT